MDEELTPERGARDAADADVAGAAAGSAGGWDRLRDGLGDPVRLRSGDGGGRESLRVADVDVTLEDREGSLVELTGAAARSLRAATTGASGSGLDAAAVCRLSGSEVLAGFADIGEARARLEVAEQVLLGEVLSRGLAPEAGFSVPDYVRTALGRRAPLPEASTVAAAVQVARATAPVLEAGLVGGLGSRDRIPGGDVVREAVSSTALPVARAAQITRFAKDVAPVADEADLGEWVDGFVTAAADVLDNHAPDDGDRGPDSPGAGRGADARQLYRALHLARLIVKPARDLEDDERRRRQGHAFTRTDGGCSATGMAHDSLILDPEGAAIIDSAVSALSAPRRLEDGTLEPGETTDPRSPATRRADALLDLVSRAVSAGGGTPATGSSDGTREPPRHRRHHRLRPRADERRGGGESGVGRA